MRAVRLLRTATELDVGNVIDCAVGKGKHATAFLSKGMRVTGIDLTPSKISHRNYHHIQQPFEELDPVKVDLVWSCHTLEHVKNVGIMLTKFREWLKPGGWLAISVPSAGQHRFHVGHLSLWTPAHLMYNLVVNGWDCKDAKWYTEYCSVSVLLQKTDNIDLKIRTAMPDEIQWLSRYMPREIIHEGNSWWSNNWHEETEPRAIEPPYVSAGIYETDLQPCSEVAGR